MTMKLRKMARAPWLLTLLLLTTAGCGGSNTGDDDSGDDDATAGDDDSTGGDDDSTAAAGERTLDNCETSIASGAPGFFKDLFRCSTVTADASNVILASTDLPPYKSYYYGEGDPNYTTFDTSRGNQYKPNEFKVGSQNLKFTIPLEPVSRGLTITGALVDSTQGTSTYEYSGGPVGMAINGVAIYDPLAGDGVIVDSEAYSFDSYGGHPDMQSTYHYHTTASGPLEVLVWDKRATTATPGKAEVEIYGIMCDGTVLLGCTEADGTKADSSQLDAQAGHVTDIKDSSGVVWFTNRYHTHVCDAGRKYTPEIQYYSTCTRAGGGGPPPP